MAAKKPAKPKPVKPAKVQATEAEQIVSLVTNELMAVRRCACGEPVAKGQTYVCKNHIRTN